jgi:diadenylate cyclase
MQHARYVLRMWGTFLKYWSWRGTVEVLILAIMLYYGYRFFRATRGARILTGLLVLLLGLTLLTELLDLEVISWILQHFSVFFALGLVVIFQPELRRVLAELGSHRIFSFTGGDEASMDQLIESMSMLSRGRVGALFALQRGIELNQYSETGVPLDAKMSPELIATIFHPKTALHDGGAVVDQGRIVAAGCVFPVSQKEIADRSIGLRHRAGIGITEETDAVALIVSEETGALSLAYKGKLEHNLTPEQLRERLVEILLIQTDGKTEERDSTTTEVRSVA